MLKQSRVREKRGTKAKQINKDFTSFDFLQTTSQDYITLVNPSNTQQQKQFLKWFTYLKAREGDSRCAVQGTFDILKVTLASKDETVRSLAFGLANVCFMVWTRNDKLTIKRKDVTTEGQLIRFVESEKWIHDRQALEFYDSTFVREFESFFYDTFNDKGVSIKLRTKALKTLCMIYGFQGGSITPKGHKFLWDTILESIQNVIEDELEDDDSGDDTEYLIDLIDCLKVTTPFQSCSTISSGQDKIDEMYYLLLKHEDEDVCLHAAQCLVSILDMTDRDKTAKQLIFHIDDLIQTLETRCSNANKKQKNDWELLLHMVETRQFIVSVPYLKAWYHDTGRKSKGETQAQKRAYRDKVQGSKYGPAYVNDKLEARYTCWAEKSYIDMLKSMLGNISWTTMFPGPHVHWGRPLIIEARLAGIVDQGKAERWNQFTIDKTTMLPLKWNNGRKKKYKAKRDRYISTTAVVMK